MAMEENVLQSRERVLTRETIRRASKKYLIIITTPRRGIQRIPFLFMSISLLPGFLRWQPSKPNKIFVWKLSREIATMVGESEKKEKMSIFAAKIESMRSHSGSVNESHSQECSSPLWQWRNTDLVSDFIFILIRILLSVLSGRLCPRQCHHHHQMRLRHGAIDFISIILMCSAVDAVSVIASKPMSNNVDRIPIFHLVCVLFLRFSLCASCTSTVHCVDVCAKCKIKF